ncbi:hypothetical protein GQ44DRAFT_706891 [Phaeosphaeriaceae sp. PMI808]|nr:hypothetical protein GQ44DRAFT_706891 [Phaeosphaeriaceae sp. PMI808]
MAQMLPPLPQPGLSIYPGFMATKPERFIAKGRNSWSDRTSYLISYCTPTGEPLEPYLEIIESQKKQISFKTMQGQEVMRIVKQTHSWSGKGAEYHGMRGDGNEIWHLKLKQGWSGTEYQMTISDRGVARDNIMIQNKVLGTDKGVFVNGHAAATMTRHEEWKHVHRHDIIHVAPGMDILLALGVNCIRADKQKQDAKTAAAAAS